MQGASVHRAGLRQIAIEECPMNVSEACRRSLRSLIALRLRRAIPAGALRSAQPLRGCYFGAGSHGSLGHRGICTGDDGLRAATDGGNAGGVHAQDLTGRRSFSRLKLTTPWDKT